jgi:hypothetical protein
MESLLDEADALVRAGGSTPPRPDFTIPEEYARVTDYSSYMVFKDAGPNKKGRGWFASQDIPAGTLVLVAKPLAMVMDWQDDQPDALAGDDDEMEDDEEEKEPRLNELLLIQVLRKLVDEPALWTEKLTELFPRDENDLSSLPAWVCHSDDVFMEVETLLSTIQQKNQIQEVKAVSKRLPLIIRYNVLSVETCNELLSYPGPDGHSKLSGIGIYHTPSFFNHSCKPNISRWAVGDVMGFVSNQDIPCGHELCISYIEHDVLCEPAWRRNTMLSMDFQEIDENVPESHQNVQDGDMGPEYPVVDADVQNELMSIDPLERLSAIDELMQQAIGAKRPQDEEEAFMNKNNTAMDTELAKWFECDVQNLRILKAITLDGLGKTEDALSLWEESIRFVEDNMPPMDESSVVLHTQAALCALHAGKESLARQHATEALRIHNLLFGGGIIRFRRRFTRDLDLSLRPPSTIMAEKSPKDELWPMLNNL